VAPSYDKDSSWKVRQISLREQAIHHQFFQPEDFQRYRAELFSPVGLRGSDMAAKSFVVTCKCTLGIRAKTLHVRPDFGFLLSQEPNRNRFEVAERVEAGGGGRGRILKIKHEARRLAC